MALWLVTWSGTPPAGADEDLILTGTVAKLDLDRLRGLLATDFGVRVFFEVPDAFLFENVREGSTITLKLDGAGRAIKVMDTSLPDLMAIPAPAGSRRPAPPAGSSTPP